MHSTRTREFETLYVIERKLAGSGIHIIKHLVSQPIVSAWVMFWTLIGGLFFTFQSYLLLHPLNGEFSNKIEFSSLAIGITLGLATGIVASLFAQKSETDWRVPKYIFILWMVIPSIFPLLFIVGVFFQYTALIDIQTSVWRAIIEYVLFGIGITLLYKYHRELTLTQGALAIILLSFLFIGKALLTDGFYLANKCPITVFDDRMAWLSNSVEEVQMYKQKTQAEKFYNSSLGQFVCTRTQEDLFR